MWLDGLVTRQNQIRDSTDLDSKPGSLALVCLDVSYVFDARCVCGVSAERGREMRSLAARLLDFQNSARDKWNVDRDIGVARVIDVDMHMGIPAKW